MAMAEARLRRRKNVLIQHEWAGLHWLRRITYPALLLADTIIMFLAAGTPRAGEDSLVGWTAKNACWRRCRRTSSPGEANADSKLRQRLAAAREDKRDW